MARFGLWVAALGLVCLIAAVTSEGAPDNSGENVCAQYFDEGTTMTIARVFDMIGIRFRDYVPDFGTEKIREYMLFADSNRDDRLNQEECENLIQYIKQRAPANPKK
ncbi:hypothetical protein KOW79_000440 [Hemibagrus wyckioides]|uniref:EF-hand domain-containing protein n=1 Tax=Hemibagrus wyckioides TaxID=337641 RepID=A0A9D3PB10_9TELE|nr:uncharacterized protein si:dkey-247k7.2 [Hemibagrus wyckioides]KAG7335747.1 hypothetical protein KOW79_000440 [Hemibagrus wyckioides]